MNSLQWIKIEPWVHGRYNQIDTYPGEGIDVLVTDGTNYDVAWYLRSQSYVWMKNNIKTDRADEFVDFIPTHWTSIPEIET